MLGHRLAAGTLLDDGRFEVKRAIKSGGMGAVYEVVDRRLGNKPFALKEMINTASDYEERQAARERFISEIQVMMTLRHPNIPRVTASFMHGNSFYFVMEFIRGVDLSEVLKAQGTPGLPPGDVVNWGLQILDALQYLHNLTPPIIHRDIKPSNILKNEDDGRVILVDFGIARVTNPGEGLWIGTPGYAPLEQQIGKHEPRSDLYALGATMYELLSGQKPNKEFDFPPIKGLDPELQDVMLHALEINPDDRPENAQEMAERLRSLSAYTVYLPSTNRAHDFESAVASYKENTLDPQLRKIITRYGNECHTPYLPRNLDYMNFVLFSTTNYELQIIKDEDKHRIRFQEKHGLLDAKPLGEVDPMDPNAEAATRNLLDEFVNGFETFKSSNWGLIS